MGRNPERNKTHPPPFAPSSTKNTEDIRARPITKFKTPNCQINLELVA